MKPKLNRWYVDVRHWCPAQIEYYFQDSTGCNWCIHLHWRHQDPWTAELFRCDENWEYINDCPDNVNLLEEKNHVPGTVTGYYHDEEYPFLMERALEIAREMKPELRDKLV